MQWADHPATAWALAALALALAAAGAQPFAGGFNDGSRLATAESLIERGTLSIDDSIFVRPPPGQALYPPPIQHLLDKGTLDKVRVDGRYYSDKPMVPAVLLAAGYRALMAVGLPRPSERPDVFCRLAAILTCGLSYAAAVGFMWVLGGQVGLRPAWRLIWLGSFALATVLPAYTRQVNPSLPQTAAVAGLALFLMRVAAAVGRTPWAALAAGGFCAGVGYTLDGASGPLLLAAATLALALRTRRIAPVAVFLLAALPWVAAHNAINYGIGHVWVPVNMVPEYLDWPDSPFNTLNMTGISRHTAASLIAYIGVLLVGENGILVYNLPLFLAVTFGWLVLLRPGPARVELLALVGWCLATGAVYAVLSDNASGGCLSIRWFVPFLVPAFWVLARLLVERPMYRADFLVLTCGGLVLSYMMWDLGPWPYLDVPYLVAIVSTSLAIWAAVRVRAIVRSRSVVKPNVGPLPRTRSAG